MQRAVLVGVFTKCCHRLGCEAFIAMAQHSTDNTMNIGRMPGYIEVISNRTRVGKHFGEGLVSNRFSFFAEFFYPLNVLRP
ncbi:MAG: hypothetical protein RJB11_1466 [Planctomycetota bacterium]|jgi:hypothetical protein